MSRIVPIRQPCCLGGGDGGKDATGALTADQGRMSAFWRRASEKPPQIEAGDLAPRQAHGQLDGGFASSLQEDGMHTIALTGPEKFRVCILHFRQTFCE